MGYAGDGHNHWHVLRMLTYHMYSPTQSTLKAAKIGFCFFDTNRKSSLPGSPRTRHYLQTGCGTRNSLSTHVGISVGWGDLYPDTFAYQWLEITGVPAGTYTVRGKIDLYDKFTEFSEKNNCTWTRISFGATGTKVKVLAHGTSCVNDHDGSAYDADIDWAVAQHIATNCDADMFCTNDRVTRGQFAQFVARAMNLPASNTDHFTDDNTSAYEADIERVAAGGRHGRLHRDHVLPERLRDPRRGGDGPRDGPRPPAGRRRPLHRRRGQPRRGEHQPGVRGRDHGRLHGHDVLPDRIGQARRDDALPESSVRDGAGGGRPG